MNHEKIPINQNWKDKVWMTLVDSITFSNMYQSVVDAKLNFASTVNKEVTGQACFVAVGMYVIGC